jgi:hypothetical protein
MAMTRTREQIASAKIALDESENFGKVISGSLDSRKRRGARETRGEDVGEASPRESETGGARRGGVATSRGRSRGAATRESARPAAGVGVRVRESHRLVWFSLSNEHVVHCVVDRAGTCSPRDPFLAAAFGGGPPNHRRDDDGDDATASRAPTNRGVSPNRRQSSSIARALPACLCRGSGRCARA